MLILIGSRGTTGKNMLVEDSLLLQLSFRWHPNPTCRGFQAFGVDA